MSTGARLAVTVALLGAAIGGLGFSGSQEAPSFITSAAERGRITSSVRATGSVEAVVTVDVSSQLSGRMAEVYVNFNDIVEAGQPIAKLDQEIFSARVNESKAALDVAETTAQVQVAALERATVAVANAKTAKRMAQAQLAAAEAKQDEVERDLQRKLQLVRTGSVTERDVSQLRAQRDTGAADLQASTEQVRMKEQAIAMMEAEQRMAGSNVANAKAVINQKRAMLEQAQLDLDRTVLRSPIDGVIIKRDVNPGQTVAVSLEAKTLFKIAQDLREMEVHGKIDEADIGQVKPGQAVQFIVDAYPDQAFSGRVSQVRKSPEVVQNVVTYTTIISARNPDLLLLPGMTAQLRVVVSDTGEVLKIPNQALRFRPNGADPSAAQPGRGQGSRPTATVWIDGGEGRAMPVRLRLGASDGNSTEMAEGPLKAGQSLIVGTASPRTQQGFFGIRLGF
ncbi:MAG: HlyD family secretion protein [Proteobacteria bacterium]|nr:MAG: HlyD family secretion protein [Pseudomonadota bacterium]